MTPQTFGTLLDATIARLRQLTQVDVRASWHYQDGEVDRDGIDWHQPDPFHAWPIAPLTEKGQIVWEAGCKLRWLGQVITVPENLQGYPLTGMTLRMAFTYWTDQAQVFVNGQLVQEGDLFDHSGRALIAKQVKPGERFVVALRLVSPGHDQGALMKSLCLYEWSEGAAVAVNLVNEPGFVADELAVLAQYLRRSAPEKLVLLERAIVAIDWDALPDRDRFQQSLGALHRQLQPLSDWIKQRRIRLLGHSHLDLVWLWTWEETQAVAQRMFKTILDLQQDFPALVFCHSSPVLYAWVEEHCPALFAAIQAQLKAGQWEALGGFWVEPELNLLNGESLVRQVLYGQRYVQARFGRLDQIAWLPDSFGFCWQLPQILSQGGVDYLVTQKLTWNDSTQFPHELFWWQAPNGSRVLVLLSGPVGEGADPLKMADFGSKWEDKTGSQDALWLIGVGDHGGGPTRDMLEVADRWQRSPLFPKLEFTTALNYLNTLRGQAESGTESGTESGQEPSLQLPIWRDEIYLECHRGCYTTHGDQKRWNRVCEAGLYQAELFAAIATIVTQTPYPQIALDQAWRKVLFNQFHDILPGSSIPEVFVTANQQWQAAAQCTEEVLAQAWQDIAAQISLPDPPRGDCEPIVVFNALNWSRSQVVTLDLAANLEGSGSAWQIFDLAGQEVPSQLQTALDSQAGNRLSFWAEDIPAIGYRVFWLHRQLIPHSDPRLIQEVGDVKFTQPSQEICYQLENEYLTVVVDPETGDLSRVVDRRSQREILRGPGNQLQLFADPHKYWDAWNIDPNYAQNPLPGSQLLSMQWLEQGPVQQRLQVVRRLNQSTFWQDYVLSAQSPVLRIETKVDWQEFHVILKAAFPLNLEADRASYEIPCGTIERPTQPDHPRDKAKWEVPALRWADLTSPPSATDPEGYGVSLLNDCKHGYDSQPGQLRLTLLRGSCWPDPQADVGIHQFTYALYPHAGTWQTAQTVRRGYELNLPLRVYRGQVGTAATPKLPTIGRFLDLQADNLVLMAFKPSDQSPGQWILRCYESQGKPAQLALTGDLNLNLQAAVDLLERPQSPESSSELGNQVTIAPWTIATFLVNSVPEHL